MTDLAPLRRALLSVSDKTGLVDLARALAARGVELLSTGGSATGDARGGADRQRCGRGDGLSRDDGRPRQDAAPDGAWRASGAARRPDHVAAMEAHGIGGIDLLVVNLYPFEDTVAKGADYAPHREYRHRRPGDDPRRGQEPRLCQRRHRPRGLRRPAGELDAHDGATSYAFRQRLALTAYARTAAYDAAVSGWMAGALGEVAPRRRAFAGTLAQTLRYGENPHQNAAFYVDGSGRPGVATARQHQGKALSYNNINDTDAAFELVAEFDPAGGPACAIIKHANPCGVARGGTLLAAYKAAFDCDRTSAFGGIVALNQPLDAETAREITGIFTEVVIAPGASDAAKEVFAGEEEPAPADHRRACRPARRGWPAIRQVAGGFLVQDKDTGHVGRMT